MDDNGLDTLGQTIVAALPGAAIGHSVAHGQLEVAIDPLKIVEIVRVLRHDGRVAIMVPTAGRGGEFLKWLPNGGVNFFAEDELGDTFEELGLVGVRTKTIGNIQWVRGRKP